MADTNGAIYGIVSEEGNIKVGNEVVLMDHATLSIIAKTTTDQYGGYMFCNLDPNKTDYMLFTVDNDGVTPKNALIKDYVQPVQSANGVSGGNFLGVLDALAPTQSGVPMFRNGGTAGSTIGCHVSRMHGGSHTTGSNVDWNGYQGYSDSTATPPTDALPIPSNPLIRAMKHTAGWSGWQNRPLRFEVWEKRIAYDLIETPKISTNAPFTIFITHKTDPAGPMTYSMCHNMRPNRDPSYTRSVYAVSLFYGDESAYFAPDCFFNVCVEADHTLRLKWLTNNGGVPNSGSKKNVLVTTLDANKWYAISVRVGDFAEQTKVDVCDVVAGTVTTYTVEAVVSINRHQNYGSLWQDGEPRRQGFRISGPHNQAVNNTFNTWNSLTCWSWLAFAHGNGYSGPWAQWNRMLSDSEAALLMRSVYDLTPFRALPRGLSEVFQHAPYLYIPFDEYPYSPPRVTRQGQRVALGAISSAYTQEISTLSLRRRKTIRFGEGQRIQPITPPGQHAFTILGFLNQPVVNGTGALVNFWLNANTAHQDDTATASYHLLYTSIESGGRLRAYWRNNANGYNDNYIGSNTALQNVGNHMFAYVFDTYYGLKITGYVDGVSVGSVAVSQQTLDTFISGLDTAHYTQSILHLSSGAQLVTSSAWHSGCYPVSGIGQIHSALPMTDVAMYQGCLSADNIAEIYDAWVLATGDDSHV